MTLFDDLENEMEHVPLDTDTADRILAGALAPEDAPPTYAAVVRLLESRAAEDLAELPRQDEMVAMVAAAVRASSTNAPVLERRNSRMTPTLARPKLAAAFVVVSLAATTSLAFAGSLPSAAQDAAFAALATLGIEVPDATGKAADHGSGRAVPEQRDGSTVCAAETGGICVEAQTSPQTLAEAARETHGLAICTRASDGACETRAGNGGDGNGANGNGGSDNGATNARVDTPSSGGTAVANAASGGASSSGGGATADTVSGGASSAGSANAGSANAGSGSPGGASGGGSGASGGGGGAADTASGGASSSGTSVAEGASSGGSDNAESASGGASEAPANVPPVAGRP